jgi:hypothetical protein
MNLITILQLHKSFEGIVSVGDYVDNMRGRVNGLNQYIDSRENI